MARYEKQRGHLFSGLLWKRYKEEHLLWSNCAGALTSLGAGLAQPMAQTPSPAPDLFLQINVYWSKAILILLRIFYDCFCTTMAELSSYSKDGKAHEA